MTRRVEEVQAEIEMLRVRLRAVEIRLRAVEKEFQGIVDKDPVLKKLPKYGDLWPADEFTGFGFSFDCGSGYWATATGYSEHHSLRRQKPSWATHVLWFNK